MNEPEKEVVARIWRNFQGLKPKQRLTASDEEKLIDDITGLMGIYRLKRDRKIEGMILEMIEFGERKRFLMAGCRFELNRIRNSALNPAKQKPI